MENSINISNNAVRSINKLMDKITSTCDQLIGVLEVSKEGVSSYGVRITDNLMDTEFVDRVIGYLFLLKRHIYDLKKFAPEHFTDTEGVKHIVEHLLETSDKLKLRMLENNYFQNTYGMLVLEITSTIDKVIAQMPVKVVNQTSGKVIKMDNTPVNLKKVA